MTHSRKQSDELAHMTETHGDIWFQLRAAHTAMAVRIVVPTNIGWRADGTNVMGAGLAAQAARRYPVLPAWYGAECRKYGPDLGVAVHPDVPVICAPTKDFDGRKPHLTWQQPATLERVQKSLRALKALTLDLDAKIAVPLLGCGLGRLDVGEVVDLIYDELGEDDRFILVRDYTP